jgi:lysophospholipase L1-like esterase
MTNEAELNIAGGGKKTILVLGDSLAFPRAHKGQKICETWPALLQRYSIDTYLWNRAYPASTSHDVLANIQQLMFYCHVDYPQIDLIVVQVGICDATPRDLPKSFERLLSLLPRGSARISSMIVLLLKLFRLRQQPWVRIEDFENNICKIADSSLILSKEVYFISIAPPCHYLLINRPGLDKDVLRYNLAIERALQNKPKCTLINPLPIDASDCLLEDGHHLTLTGHQLIAKTILKLSI